MEKKSVAEMIGDFFREAAVLVIVFAFLDKLIDPGSLTILWISGTIALSVFLLAVGIVVERRRA